MYLPSTQKQLKLQIIAKSVKNHCSNKILMAGPPET